jgi:hypothetical protein
MTGGDGTAITTLEKVTIKKKEIRIKKHLFPVIFSSLVCWNIQVILKRSLLLNGSS